MIVRNSEHCLALKLGVLPRCAKAQDGPLRSRLRDEGVIDTLCPFAVPSFPPKSVTQGQNGCRLRVSWSEGS